MSPATPGLYYLVEWWDYGVESAVGAPAVSRPLVAWATWGLIKANFSRS